MQCDSGIPWLPATRRPFFSEPSHLHRGSLELRVQDQTVNKGRGELQACDPSIWEMEAGGQEFKTSLSYEAN